MLKTGFRGERKGNRW